MFSQAQNLVAQRKIKTELKCLVLNARMQAFISFSLLRALPVDFLIIP